MATLIKHLYNLIRNTNTYLLVPILLTSVSLLLIVLIFFLLSSVLPAKLPLFYSLAWGEAQLANRSQLYILPAVVLGIGLLNFIIFAQLHSSQIILKRMLLMNIIVVDIIILISLFKIITIFI